jgi:hypothetical protein
MARISRIKRLPHNGGFSGRREACPKLIVNRKRPNNSAPLAAWVPVKFMEVGASMCRWPIGDPQQFETFRFCGSACRSGVVYCKAHNAKAHVSKRPGPLRASKFWYNL